ncbi:MAG: hypothetical protein AUF76_03440 [Acidobacteria bacterium 13_1_20CM_2_65_9]|nr:MAG: hypothetical protein AUF76_03440 [Acidobacteria bacterium 13_1_20CM_2_65_9]
MNRRNSDQCRRAASGIDCAISPLTLTACPGLEVSSSGDSPTTVIVSSSMPIFMTMSTARFNPARMIRSSRTAFEKPESVAVSA